ncbi:MAG: trypsin-like serine protease [Planctomycetia bacterium]|nr:trypsin-like serine protease [Planctomycetia bacterium]
MSLFNMSSLRGILSNFGKTGKKASKSEQLKRHLALDTLEDRVLLTVTPSTVFDIQVNQAVSTNQSTETNGNAIAVDDDGDIVVTWTRTDTVYQYTGTTTLTYEEDGIEYKIRTGDVGLYNSETKSLTRLFTQDDAINKIPGLTLGLYTDENGNAVSDDNVYARYLTDELQRLVIDTSRFGDGNYLQTLTIAANTTCVQSLKLTTGADSREDFSGFMQFLYTTDDGTTHTSDLFELVENATDESVLLQNARNIKEALENFVVNGEHVYQNVNVTVNSSDEYLVSYETVLDANDNPIQKIITAEVVQNNSMATLPSFVGTWVTYPTCTREIQVVYKVNGNGELEVNLEATAANIQNAINNMKTTVTNAPDFFRSTEGPLNADDKTTPINRADEGSPKLDPELYTQSTIEVSVVPVELENGLIGFDVTFVNGSGKQDMPELVVKTMTVVPEAELDDYSENSVTYRKSGSYDVDGILIDDTDTVSKYYTVTTLKQNSNEFRVNSPSDDKFNRVTGIYTATAQNTAAVAMDSDGDFAITWTSEVLQTTTPGSYTDIYARTYTPKMLQQVTGYQVNDAGELEANTSSIANGLCWTATSDPFVVNSSTTGPQSNASIAVDDKGNFVIVWASNSQEESYANSIYMQRYDSDGNRVGNEVRVDYEQTREAYTPQVSISSDGKYIGVAWAWGNGLGVMPQITMKLYGVEDDGSLTTLQEAYTVGLGRTPSISFNESNQFAVAWAYQSQTGDSTLGVDCFYSQYIWENGGLTVLRDGYCVNNASQNGQSSTDTWNGDQVYPRVVLDADGDIVISYYGNAPDVSENAFGDPLTSSSIFLTMLNKYFEFDAAGNAIGTNADIYNWLYLPVVLPGNQTEVGTESTWLQFYQTPFSLFPMVILPGDVDSLITAYLANAQQNGATEDQLGRMNNILTNIMGTMSGEYIAAMFSMYDANQNETQTLYTDSIANANRDGKNASFYIDIVDMAWQSYTMTITVGGTSYDVSFMPVFTINAAGETEMDTTATATAIKTAIQTALAAEGDSWRVSDDFEGIVEVIPFDDYADVYDGTNWEYDTDFRDDDFTYHTFLVEFQGSLHDRIIEERTTSGSIAVSQVQTIQVVEGDHGYFWLQINGAAMTATTPLIYWDGNFDSMVGQVRAALTGSGYDQANFRIDSDADTLTVRITWVAGLAGQDINLVASNSAVPLNEDGTPIRTVTGTPVTRVNNRVEQNGEVLSFTSAIPRRFSALTPISSGSYGTSEYGTGIGVQPNGSFSYVWSQTDLSSLENLSLANIYIRNFRESQDNAGPQILDYYYYDGTKITDGKQLTDLTANNGLGAFIVTFSEQMLDSDALASPTNNQIAASVTNVENWILKKDGIVIENAIQSIEFGMNRSADADMQALGISTIGENKWEAIVIFNDGIDLEDGTYELIATNGMFDLNGNPLGKTGMLENGQDSSRNFNIIVGSNTSEKIGEGEFIDPATAPTPVSTASDYEGDNVTVWKNTADDRIWATISYVKWDNTDGKRTSSDEGATTFAITGAGLEVEHASVAMTEDGKFVVTWSQNDGTTDSPDWNVYFAMYDLDGSVLIDATMANSESTTPIQQRYSSVDISLTGEFVITWQSYRQDGSASWDIYAQIFNRDGEAIGLEGKTEEAGGTGKEFLVNDTTTLALDQQNPVVAIDNYGNFVIAWTALGQGEDSTANSNIVARRFVKDTTVGSTVTTAGAEYIVNDGTYTVNGTTRSWQENNQKWASIAMDADGDFVISWTSYGHDGTGNGFGATATGVNGVYAQRYDNTGATVGEQFLVNTTTENDQQKSKVSMDADGDFIIVWESYQETGDGTLIGPADNWGVYAQRYASNEKFVADTTGVYGVFGEIGGEFRVYEASLISGNQTSPGVAMTHTGDFYIAWQSDASGKMEIYRRSTDRPVDDTGSIVVEVLANTTTRKTTGVSNGTIVQSAVKTLDVVFGEQLVEDSTLAASILNLKNWDLTKDGESITNLIDHIEVVGYDQPNSDYPSGENQKDIYRIVFKQVLNEETGLMEDYILTSGQYTLTIYDDVTDLFNNYLDGNADGKNYGDYTLSFVIEQTTIEDTSISNSAFTGSNAGNTPSATVADSTSGSGNVIVWMDTTGVDENRGIWIGTPSNNGYSQNAVQVVNDATAKDASLARYEDENGDITYLVTWTQTDGTALNVYCRRFDEAFTPLGDAFQVNEDTNSENSQIAVLSDGSFIVVWEGDNGASGRDIFMREYNADGSAKGNVEVVNTTTANDQYDARITVNAAGKCLISWTGDVAGRSQIYARVLGEASDFLVSSSSNAQNYSSIGMDATGNFVVTWTEDNDVYAKRFGSDNVALPGTLGEAFVVNDTLDGTQKNSVVAMNSTGEFAIVWQSENGEDWSILRKSYVNNETYTADQGGNHQYGDHGEYSEEIEISRVSDDPCYSPNVTLDGTSGTITWQENLGEDAVIYSTLFDILPTLDEEGHADGDGTITVADGWIPVATAMDYEGDMVSVWSSGTQVKAKIDYVKWDYTNEVRGEAKQASPTSKIVTLDVGATAEFVSVAMDDAGDFVVTWSQNDGTAASPEWNIYACRFDLNGEAKGDIFRVNSTTYSQQRYSTVSMSSDGQFVIAWQAYQQDAFNTGWDIYVKKYDADGNVCSLGGRKSDYLVNSRTVGDSINQQQASVSMDAEGNFVVTWTEQTTAQESNIFGRLFQNNIAGDIFQVNTGDYDYTADGITEQSKWSNVAMGRDGNFVVTWTSRGHEDNSSKASNGVFAKMYSSSGVAYTTSFQVNTTEVNDQQLSRVAIDADGDFVISWESFQEGNNGTVAPEDATNYGVYVQRFSSDGVADGIQTRMNSSVPGNQRYANVVMTHTGDYAVTWYSDIVDGQTSNTLKRYKKWNFKRDAETNKIIDDTGNVVVRVEGVSTDDQGNEVKTTIHNGDVLDEVVKVLDVTFGEQINPDDGSLDSVLNANNWIIRKDGVVISSALFIESIEVVGYDTTDESYANNTHQKNIIRLTFNEEYLTSLSEGLANGTYEITLSERAKDVFGNMLDEDFTFTFTLATPTPESTDTESDVTPDTNYDVKVNQQYSQNQSTETNGNSIAVDDDGDIIATWTRGDNVYYYSGGTFTLTENGVEYTVKSGDVGLIQRNQDGTSTLVRLFTEMDFVTYADEMSVAGGKLNKYIDPSSTSGAQLVDYNVYARYLTDEVQRLVIDTTAAGDGNSICDLVLSTGGNCVQKVSFTSIETLSNTSTGPIYSNVTVRYNGVEASFDYYESSDIVQTYQNAAKLQGALEEIFGEDNVIVTPTSSCEFNIEFVSNKNGGTTPTSLIEIQLTDPENPDSLASTVIAGATASWVRKPVTTRTITIPYNTEGNIDLTALATMIENAFNVDSQTNYAEAPTLFRDSSAYGTSSYDRNLDADTVYVAPATSPNVVQDPIIEISVVAVEGLTEGLIGFDITFTGVSGKQDMPELVVESIREVATGDTSASPTALDTSRATNITTIKECSDEFRVNPASNDAFQWWNSTYVATDQKGASVAVDSDGNFAISWTSEAVSSELPGSSTDIYVRTFTPQMKNIVTKYEVSGGVLTATTSDRVDGTCVKANGEAFRVNDTYSGAQFKSSISMDDSGNLAVVWQSGSVESVASNGIYMKVYSYECWTEGDSDYALTNEIRVDEGSTTISQNPVVAMSPDGSYIVVAWESGNTIAYQVYVQSTDAAGNPSYTASYRNTLNVEGHFPSIAFTYDNVFSISWESESVDTNTNETTKDVYLSQFKLEVVDDAVTCTTLRDQYRVNSSSVSTTTGEYWTGDQSGSTVAMDANGNIIVSYEGSGVDTSENVAISSSRMRQLLSEYFTGLNEDLKAFVNPNNFMLTKVYYYYLQTEGTGEYYYPDLYTVNYTSKSGQTINTSGDPDAILKVILVDAQENGATDEQLGRLYAVMNNVFSLLRGESNGALFTIYDSTSTATNTVYSDSIANARRDGSNTTFYIKLDRQTGIEWTNCELYVYKDDGSYTAVTFEPVYEEIEVGEDTIARLLVNDTGTAIATALRDALFSGTSWSISSPDSSEGPVSVRVVNLEDYGYSYWDSSSLLNVTDDSNYAIYEVTFQGTLHDTAYAFRMGESTATIGDNDVTFVGNGNRIGAYTIHTGDSGTEQHDVSVGMASNGNFSFLWTSDDLTSYGVVAGQNIYTRTFTQVQDLANPLAKELWYTDSTSLEYVDSAKTLKVNSGSQSGLIVVFNEEMLNHKTITNLSSDSQNLSLVANSVTNTSNWVLVKDGTEILCDAIESVEFGMNRSADMDMQGLGITALAENKWEAVVVLKDGLELEEGSYELRLAGNVVDVNGNKIGDTAMAFTVDPGATPELPEEIDDNTYTTLDSEWVPNATASDNEGDTVTVYNDSTKGGIWATVSYTKWETSPRTRDDEGTFTFQITDDPTAQYASVAMDGSGNFVVVWQQDDGEANGGVNIHASLYDLNGVAIREDFLVNDTLDDTQCFASVAMDLDGDFVITWQSKDSLLTGHDWNIRAQRYTADGTEFNGAYEVQSLSFLEEWSGDFDLTLNVEGMDYTTDRITSSGNTYGTVAKLQAALDKLAAEINAAGGAQYTFVAKATGSTLIEIQIQVDGGSWDTELFRVDHSIGASAKSGLEVVLSKDGTKGEFMVNQTVIYDQTYASVDMDYDGNFVISWTNTYKDKTTDIYARKFYSNDYIAVENTTTIEYIRTGIDPTEMETEYASGVGIVLVQTDAGIAYGSGTVLTSGRHVLTAAHVVTDGAAALEAGNVYFRYYNSEGWHQVRIVSVSVNPEWDGVNPVGDVAILELEESLIGLVETYDINRDSTADKGATYVRYGYGLIGDPESGAIDNMDWNTLLAANHRGMNTWDAVGSDLDGTTYGGLGDNLLIYDYDSGLAKDDTLGNVLGIKNLGLGVGQEACGAHGDSGGPCIVNGLIYGICQGGFSDTSDYGTVGMDTRISYYADWIDGIVGSAAATGEFLVNTVNTTGKQTWSSVGLDADGDFVITWTSTDTCLGSSAMQVYAKQYDASANAKADEFLVTSDDDDTAEQQWSKVAVDADGDFVITWEEHNDYVYGINSEDNGDWNVWLQAYKADGSLVGDQEMVHVHEDSDQRFASVAIDACGDYIVTWNDSSEGKNSLYTRRYNRSTDYTAPELVRITTNLDASQGGTIFGDKSQLVSGEELPETLYFVFDEEMNVTTSGSLYANSVLNPKNWTISRNGTTLLNAVESITIAGYDQTGSESTYPFYQTNADGTSTIEKNIFQITFKDGTFDESGTYVITLSGQIEDEQGNKVGSTGKDTAGVDQKITFTLNSGKEDYEDIGNAEGPYDDLVNSYTDGNEKGSVVAMDADGNYVVVWERELVSTTTTSSTDDDTDGTTDDDTSGTTITYTETSQSIIVGKRFDRYGNAISDEFYVSDVLDGVQSDPSIAMDAFGNFVVSWTAKGMDTNGDGVADENEKAEYDVYARVFSPNCIPVSDSFVVSTTTDGDQSQSSVAISDDGSGFVVTWTNRGSQMNEIHAQRFNFSGSRNGSEFLVSNVNGGEMSAVGMDANDNIVVVWQYYNGIYMRKFDANNNALSGVIKVSETSANDATAPDIAMNDVGQFVVGWESSGVDGSNKAVCYRTYNSDLSAITGQMVANTATADAQYEVSVAIQRESANGNAFLVSWTSYQKPSLLGTEYTQEYSRDIFARRFNSLSTTAGSGEFLVNYYTASDEVASCVAMDAWGNGVVVWTAPDAAATGDKLSGTFVDSQGKPYTDIYSRNLLVATVPGYVSPAFHVTGSAVRKSTEFSSSKNYSALTYGGGSIATDTTPGSVTISAAKGANNLLLFQASATSSTKPAISLNGAAIELDGSYQTYTFDASTAGTTSNAVVVVGDGGEVVTQNGNTIVVTNSRYTLTILNADLLSEFTFNGTGDAQALLTTSTDGDGAIFTASGSDATLVSATTILRVTGCGAITVNSKNDKDKANVTGNSGSDTFLASESSVRMTGTGYDVSVNGFVDVYAAGGQNDTVNFTGSTSNTLTYAGGTMTFQAGATRILADSFATASFTANGATASMAAATLMLVGGSDLTATGSTVTFAGTTFDGFTQVTVNGCGGQASLYDTAASDKLVVNGSDAVLSGKAYSLTVNGFDTLAAKSENGGKDSLQVSGVAGDFVVTNDLVTVAACTFDGFDVVKLSSSQGTDTLTINGTESAESFIVSADSLTAQLKSAKYTAEGFANVSIEGNGGGDSLNAYDSAGDDLFELSPGRIAVSGSGFQYSASGIGTILASHVRGGADTVRMIDTEGQDTVAALPEWVTMVSEAGQMVTANGFENVEVTSVHSTNDTAILYDSEGDDLLEVTTTDSTQKNTKVSLSGTQFFNTLAGFSRYSAISLFGGNDTAKIYNSLFDEEDDDLLSFAGDDVKVDLAYYDEVIQGVFGE